jgi:outer membrane immunogenic protein
MVGLRHVVGALAAVMFMSGTVCAGEQMNTKASPSYSGPYIGAFVGQSWSNLEYVDKHKPTDRDMDGFAGGLYLGHNYRIDNLILGFETDAGFCDLSEGADDNNFNSYSAFEIDWNAHLRARAGFAYNSTLFYIAGGLTVAKVGVDDTDDGYGNDNETHFGWTIGAGIEHKITEHLTARIEYLYDDYGSEDYYITDDVHPYPAEVELKIHSARIGLAYSF